MLLLENIIWLFQELFIFIEPVLVPWFDAMGYTFDPLYFVVIALAYCLTLVLIPVLSIKIIKWLFDF